jgi:hypothetical protein
MFADMIASTAQPSPSVTATPIHAALSIFLSFPAAEGDNVIRAQRSHAFLLLYVVVFSGQDMHLAVDASQFSLRLAEGISHENMHFHSHASLFNLESTFGIS